MGCGGSRADTIEPRYYESWTRETESTWLTNTDTEIGQTIATNNQRGRQDSESPSKKQCSSTCQGKGEGCHQSGHNPPAASREKKMVNTATQCGRLPLQAATSSSGGKGRPFLKEEGKPKPRELSSKETITLKTSQSSSCREDSASNGK